MLLRPSCTHCAKRCDNQGNASLQLFRFVGCSSPDPASDAKSVQGRMVHAHTYLPQLYEAIQMEDEEDDYFLFIPIGSSSYSWTEYAKREYTADELARVQELLLTPARSLLHTQRSARLTTRAPASRAQMMARLMGLSS